MPEKTYTLHELVNRLRDRESELVEKRIDPNAAALGLIVALGYELTVTGYDQFDADLTAVGL